MTSEVLLLAGRSRVGKSSVAFGYHDALRAAGVWHCVIDGDMLDMAYPTPWEHILAERNLAAMQVVSPPGRREALASLPWRRHPGGHQARPAGTLPARSRNIVEDLTEAGVILNSGRFRRAGSVDRPLAARTCQSAGSGNGP
jgi:hypothetical protein